MIVKAYYSGGRIDVFDTDRMTDGTPQPGNLLTNYTLDLADVNGESLWLCYYYYEAADIYRDELGPKGLPVARRRDGWSFLIADADDLQRLNRVTMDGETVLIQIADELVDAVQLSWAYDVVEEHIPHIASTCKLIDKLGLRYKSGCALSNQLVLGGATAPRRASAPCSPRPRPTWRLSRV